MHITDQISIFKNITICDLFRFLKILYTIIILFHRVTNI